MGEGVCINNSSSAELSEAINSMYRWYAESDVCYVYLNDVTKDINPEKTMFDFLKSKWFTRGWTLQELLAPDYVGFLDQFWSKLGTKHTLSEAISSAAGIPKVVDVASSDRYWSCN